ncbi:MAG TPA: hypothetical protein VI603_02380 [Saprospiraceae bacterium]|nr:hypothetical protein [Saprospiraceae bacterium]
MQLKTPTLFLFFTISSLQLNTAQNPTWADDVACIVYNNCTKCHHPGGIAPVSFLTYDDVYAKRASVRIYVQDRVMPPSPAIPGDIPFRDDNLLTDEEIQTIVTWVNQGAPSGDLGMAPPAPPIADTEEIPDPDGILKIDTYASQAIFSDDYRCFAFETNFGEDKWMTGIEIVPGNKNIVHHVILYEDATDVVLGLDEADPLPGYQCFGGVGSFNANFVGGWVPGQTAQFLPDGMGLLIPTSTNLIIQAHYPEESNGQLDSTKVNLRFAENGDGLRQIRVTPYINHITSLTNGPLFIPANTIRSFHAEAVVFGNVSIVSVLPHMHLLGTSMSCYAVLPSMDTIQLFDIPVWDFDWQLAYHFRSPIHLPFGTRLIADAVYDNTVNNPSNPNFPPQNVSQGEATTDEMFLIFFSYLNYETGDENMVFEDAPPLSDACAGSVSTSQPIRPQLKISPNPVDRRIVIAAPWSDYTVALFDGYGRILLTGHRLTEVYTGSLTEGMYIIVVENGVERLVEKVMVAH